MTFQIGEKVVYPNHGIGTIENISSRAFGSQHERFYLLRLSPTSMTVMVPFSHVGNVGLRKITRCSQINRVLSYLAAGRPCCAQDWKDRFKENSDKMRGGSLIDIAEVFKALLVLQLAKPLSFREKRMLERSRSMLILETSIAKAVSECQAVALIGRALMKSGLPMPAAL